jgi:hypothetical protein
MLSEQDLAEMEARAVYATNQSACPLYAYTSVEEDVPALVAEVRRLRDALATAGRATDYLLADQQARQHQAAGAVAGLMHTRRLFGTAYEALTNVEPSPEAGASAAPPP